MPIASSAPTLLPLEMTAITTPATTTPLGVYHTVERGETLWRIAQAYDVSVQDITEHNRMSDLSRIEIGQLLFIPGRTKKRTAVDTLKVAYQPVVSEPYFQWPVRGTILHHYGELIDGVRHKGIDVKALHGTPVRASKSGVISFRNERVKGFGKVIIIDHSEHYQTVYAHLDELFPSAGEHVKQGEAIATVGATGRATEAKLHFEIRHRGIAENPLTHLE